MWIISPGTLWELTVKTVGYRKGLLGIIDRIGHGWIIRVEKLKSERLKMRRESVLPEKIGSGGERPETHCCRPFLTTGPGRSGIWRTRQRLDPVVSVPQQTDAEPRASIQERFPCDRVSSCVSGTTSRRMGRGPTWWRRLRWPRSPRCIRQPRADTQPTQTHPCSFYNFMYLVTCQWFYKTLTF